MSKEITPHAERAHAVLSCSGASRWMNCTPSARLEEQFPDQDSEYAKEGTLAHELAELKLRSLLKLFRKEKSTKKETDERRARVKEIMASPYYNKEMEGHTDDYCAFVMNLYAKAKEEDPAALMLIEERVNLRSIIEDGEGTCDVIIISRQTLTTIDLKYGQGVQVEATNNSQLKLYGFGALEAYGFLYNISEVQLIIFQPRRDHISEWTTAAQDLTLWANIDVQIKAAVAFKGEGDQMPGSWCHFCKARVHCKALADETTNTLLGQLGDTFLMNDEQLLEIYEKKDRLIKYVESVADYVYMKAIEGKSWTGYKLVEGKSAGRKIVNEKSAEEALIEAGYLETDIYTRKFKGIGEMEALLGKKGFTDLLGDFTIKPPGKPAFVPESDKREPLNLNPSGTDLFGEE